MFCDNLYDISPIPQMYTTNYNFELDENNLYPLREVEFYELEYIEEVFGEAFVIVNGTPDYLQSDCIHFRRKGEIVQGGGKYKSRYIEFSYSPTSETNDALSLIPSLYTSQSCIDIKSVFDDIYDDYYNDSITLKINYKVNVLKILSYMINQWYFNSNQNENSVWARSIHESVHYIVNNFALPLTVADLASQAGYSVYHYTRLFKEFTHFTPVQFLSKCRINYAKKALAETTESAQAIMIQCGFNSYSYFFRVFKKACSMTPNEYRILHSDFKIHRSNSDT